jgi:CDGSH-type Zn-finger protein
MFPRFAHPRAAGGRLQDNCKEHAMAVDIVATKNGPYLVTGDLSQLELRDGDGSLYDLAGKRRVFLCRCGASTTKPFCDGQHSKIGFQAAEAAVKTSG